MNKDYVPLVVAVFLVLGGLFFHGQNLHNSANNAQSTGFFGIPFVAEAHGAQSSRAINDLTIAELSQGGNGASLPSPSYTGGLGGYVAQEEGAAFNSQDGEVQDPGGTFADNTSQSGIVSYVVRPGDTLASIAQYFGISQKTITTANPRIRNGIVLPGQTLKILPVSGFLYTTVQGDTLSSIAKSFNVSPSQIVQANPSVNFGSSSIGLTFLTPGITLIIPSGK